MNRSLLFASALALLVPICSATAQSGTKKSTSSGFFLGAGAEGIGITTDNDRQANGSGGGAGLVLGYGFNSRWSLYGQASGATINADGGGSYSLGHFDVGARVHFRTGPNIVVPCLQFGLSAIGFSDDVSGVTFSGSGGALSLGGGFNAYFTPKVALSTAVTVSTGNFDRFQVGNFVTSNISVNAVTSRLLVGLVWFPQG
ncbi:MAG: outer membrane beta-barrel protein [bacterium]